MPIVALHKTETGVLHVTLHDPSKRNALGLEMFDAIDDALSHINTQTRCVLLQGEGPVFCAGFDMKACVDDIAILKIYILRLSTLIRSLRRLPVPVVAAAHGAAIAGGCALLTGCDFIVGSKESKYGYPVHRIGISPAVTIPTLFQKLGNGQARTLALSGRIIGGNEALAIGLLTHLEETNERATETSLRLADSLANKPPLALQTTKRWLNELDGSLNDELFDAPANHSATVLGEETKTLLNQVWNEQ
ncbi:MAG: enoyl-CoA hydratase/isomerase family protein [Planctomycetes bacterium]|nr:enoyl-CoA hydratase/isomerase family protein [Planctomycetota bacterium]